MRTERKNLLVLGLVLLFGVFFISSASAQVLATAETGGKGNQAVLVSVNGLFPEGLELFNIYGQYIYGVTGRLDMGLVYGNISSLGRTQHYAGLGWNLNIFRRDQVFVDISFFGAATVPLNKRDEASTAFTAPALVVSRPVTVYGRSVSLYSGVTTNVPISRTADKLFTPPDTRSVPK